MTNKNEQRLPPGQQLVAAHKWPIIGEREPEKSALPWRLEIVGQVGQPVTFSIADLQKLPQTTIQIDIHCVTRWSKFDVEFSGVLLSDLLREIDLKEDANFVSFVARSERNHSTSLSLEDALAHQTLIATHAQGQPLSQDHGGPIRNIVPGKYFYKSVKWLCNIQLLPEDRLGYWEAETGYHNGADPWLEQRYMAPSIDRRTASLLISSKDFAGRDLRSIDARNRNLDHLNAEESLLRDANFENASLQDANFARANLSNAHLRNANLQRANLAGTDLEGADLAGADLRGANLDGCSLIGASFCDVDSNSETVTNEAIVDFTTKISADSLVPLTEIQSTLLKRLLGLPQ